MTNGLFRAALGISIFLTSLSTERKENYTIPSWSEPESSWSSVGVVSMRPWTAIWTRGWPPPPRPLPDAIFFCLTTAEISWFHDFEFEIKNLKKYFFYIIQLHKLSHKNTAAVAEWLEHFPGWEVVGLIPNHVIPKT